MTTLVILPGLDGLAVLHEEFRALVAPAFDAINTIAYPPDQMLDYAQLEAWVRERLPREEPIVLLGESFSSVVALSIAADAPRNLQGVVLSTGFATIPATFMRMLSPIAALLPVHHTPEPALSWLLFGRWDRPDLLAKVRASLAQVEARVLRHRMQIAANVDVSKRLPNIAVPVLILAASEDSMLPLDAARHMKRLIPDVELKEIKGPHLLLQAVPEQMAEAIHAFVHRRLPQQQAQPDPA